MRSGRNTFQVLCHLTRLSPRQVKYGLSVLIQQRLVFWHTPLLQGAAVYEANVQTAVRLVRAGKYVQVAGDRFGILAGEIISTILEFGSIRITDVLKECRLRTTSTEKYNEFSKPHSTGRTALTNNTDGGQNGQGIAASSQETLRVIGDLLEFGLICAVYEASFRSEADNEMELDAIVPAADQFKGRSKREKEAAREQKMHEKRLEWKYGTREERKAIENFKVSLKRPLDDSEDPRSRKRARIDETSDDRIVNGSHGAINVSNGFLLKVSGAWEAR